MNVADLLQDAPSDDRSRRFNRGEQNADQQPRQQQQQQPQQPPHRPPHHSPPLDRPRDNTRDRPSHDVPHPQQQHPLRRSPPPFLAGRPPSPPRHPPPYGAPGDFPGHAQGVHHLPPPSSLLEGPYDVQQQHRSRRANPESLPHPHERLGPPPGPSAPIQAQPFVVEHRSSSSKHTSPHPGSHHHHQYHGHTHPGTPSSMHMPPPPQRSHHGSPPLGHLVHGPGQGSIPLFPTPVGPGVPPGGPHLPPPPHSSSAMSMRLGEPSPMYGAPPQGPSPPHPHAHSHSHSHDRSHDRSRGRGSSTSSAAGPVGAFDVKSSTSSPVMASLQRPTAYDERDGRERDPGPGMGRPRGPLSGTLGPGIPSGSTLPSMNATAGRSQDSVTHLLPGPGLHPTALSEKRERERERGVPMDRERDRRSSGASVHDSPGSVRREQEQRERQAMKERERQERYAQQREREIREQEHREQELRRERRAKEREMQMREQEAQIQMQLQVREQEREREQRERDRLREREQREREQREQDFRMHAHGMMGMSVGLGLGAGMSMSAAEREREEREQRDREWLQKAQQQMEARGSRQHQHQHQHQLQHQLQHQPPPPPPPMQTMGPPQGHGQGQVWPRFVTPSGPSPEEERMLQEREMQRRGMEDVRMRELEWESEKVERQPTRTGKSRTSTKDREPKDGQREDRRRTSVREKEREREKLEMEMQQEREREHRRRERELVLQKEAQYELMERERIQRQRDLADMETIRAVRAREEQMQQQMQAQGQVHGAPQQHIHHVHPHHHQHPAGPGSQLDPRHLKGQSGKQGGMGPGPMPQDLPPQYQHERERDFRQGSSKGLPHNQMGIPPPHLAQGMPMPHPMAPGPHMRQHPPPDMYPPHPGAHVGYPGRRPSPPPGHGPPVPMINPAYMFPRSSSPSSPPVFAVRHLGTFVLPRTPFPFFDFPAPTSESGALPDPLDIRATIYVPCRFLPLTRPARPRIWGGALIPAVPPLTGAQRALCQQFTPANSQFGRPWPDEVREGRRVYTDDSDLFLCALHAGWVSWSAARRARREGQDLVMEVRLTREARYIGGYGSPLRARERERERERGEEELGSEDDGSSLLSSGWGNGHDGAGVEVLSAEFVQPGSAHSFGLRNRSQRLLEYAERRCALGCAPKLSRKRRRLHGPAFADGVSTVQLKLDQADEELSATRVMVFGTDSSWPEIGFKYHPEALKSVLFPQSTTDGRPSKRRKLAAIADNAPPDSTPPADAVSEDELVPQRAVVVETLWESFLISQRGQIPSGESGDAEPESDKENTSTSGDGAGRRYVIALLTNAGGTAGKLPRKSAVAAKTSEGESEPVPESEPEPEPEPEGDKAPVVDGTSAGAGAAQEDAAPGEAEKVSQDGSAALPTDPAAPVSLERAQSKLSDESVDDPDDGEGDGDGPIRILHHDLGEENFEFVADGINVLSSEVVNGMRKGWKLEAQQWKWVQVGVTS